MPGQPKALYVLFMTELWERFGYYSLVSVFTLYLIDELKIAEQTAFLIFGAYTAFIYLTGVAGGFAADKVLGYGQAILLGAAIMCFGYVGLAFGAVSSMYAALALLVVGNGFFKPNVSALLGVYYEADDPRRSAGFTLFYMGINVGGLLGSLLAGLIAQKFGYPVAFAVAGAGKLVSMATFWAGRRGLEARDFPSPDAMTNARGYGLVVLYIVVALAAAVVLLSRPEAAGVALGIAVGVVFAGYLAIVLREPLEIRNRLLVHLALVIAAIAFFAVYQQYAVSVTVFTDKDIDRTIFGWHLPASEFTSLNPAFILLFSPLLALLWPALARRGRGVDDLLKFVLGLAFLGLGYWLLVAGIVETAGGAKTTLGWIVGFYALFTLGELCLSPVGLALTTRLAPPHLAGLVMGVWLMALTVANYGSGLLGQLVVLPKGAAAAAEVAAYREAFLIYGAIAIATGIVLLLVVPQLRRLIGDAASVDR
ncbi:MAG: peptide MFS transporter [Alphaproteobacteria bacterium]|jgi:POT family proton-dependent oligopeptide transporter